MRRLESDQLTCGGYLQLKGRVLLGEPLDFMLQILSPPVVELGAFRREPLIEGGGNPIHIVQQPLRLIRSSQDVDPTKGGIEADPFPVDLDQIGTLAIEKPVQLGKSVAQTYARLGISRQAPKQPDEAAARNSLAAGNTQYSQNCPRFPRPNDELRSVRGDYSHVAEQMKSDLSRRGLALMMRGSTRRRRPFGHRPGPLSQHFGDRAKLPHLSATANCSSRPATRHALLMAARSTAISI